MEINLKEFRRAVERCGLIVPKKGSLAILNMILIEGGKTFIKVMATNLEEFYLQQIPVRSGEKFKLLIPCDQLWNVIKNMKTGSVTVTLERDNTAQFSAMVLNAGCEFRIVVENNTDDFPVMQETHSGRATALKISNQKLMFELIKKVIFSTTKLNVNRAYSGILFSSKKEYSDMVTTDIHRLSIVRSTCFTAKADFVIPVESAKKLMRLFDDTAIESAVIVKDDNMDEKLQNPVLIKVQSEKALYTSILLKNEFPNYNVVLNTATVERSWFQVDRKLLAEKLKFIVDFHRSMKIVGTVFDFVNGKLFLSARGEGETEVKAEIAITPVNEDPEVIKIQSLNSRYVLEAILSMGSIVRINTDPGKHLKPFYIAESTDEYKFYHLVMPLRMDGVISRKTINKAA